MDPRPFAVGDRFTHVRACDRYRPIYYGAASGDFNPIHIDAEVGQAANLGGVILQGLCTMAWATEAFVNYVGDPGKVSRAKVRFSKPVSIDDVITFTGTVTAVADGKLFADVEAKNQKGEDVLKGAQFEARL